MTTYPFPEFPDNSQSFKLSEPVLYRQGIEVELVWAPASPRTGGNQYVIWSVFLESSSTGHKSSLARMASTASNRSSRISLLIERGELEDQEVCDLIVVARLGSEPFDTLNQDAHLSKVDIPSARPKKWGKVVADAFRDADMYGNGWIRVSKGNTLERVDPRHVFVVDEDRPQYATVELSNGGEVFRNDQ